MNMNAKHLMLFKVRIMLGGTMTANAGVVFMQEVKYTAA